jgi:hypothetical protein
MRSHVSLLVALLMAALAPWLTPGCSSSTQRPSTMPPSLPGLEPPTLRVHVVSSMAGALEPCGCVKDMLGGIDHAAALVHHAAAAIGPRVLMVGAGPMLFSNRSLPAVGSEQHRFKAQAIAESFRDMGLAAWAPGANDWAAGPAELRRLESVSGATLLSTEPLAGAGAPRPVRVVDVKGLRVGLAGVSRSDPARGANAASEADAGALLGALSELKSAGARILILLIALPRGEALRLVERVPGFHLAVVGKDFDDGEANDPVTAPVLVGKTPVIQPPNHLQAISVVDFYVKDQNDYFEDSSGIVDKERRERLSLRARELEQRLAEWEKPDSGALAADIEARRAELSQLKQQIARDTSVSFRQSGSFFDYQVIEIREALGSDSQVLARMNAYYRRVNEHNREAFKDRVPAPAPAGESSYVGGAACAACHEEEDKFWRTTRHASAYQTLVKGNKEFNLECVGCHVTGYERPGGSTVTHVSRLKDVRCEVCHGPGSRHAADPARRDLVTRTPRRTLCASECHHPPHVKEDWSVEQAWPKILGPGHGAP